MAKAQKVRQYKVAISPTPLQEKVLAFYQAGGRFAHLNCGRRTGKTHAGLMCALTWAQQNPGSIIWWVGPSYRQIKGIVWRKLLKILPKSCIVKRNDTELSIEFVNRSILELKGSDSEDSLRGPAEGLGGLIMEEAAFHKGNVYEEILRPQIADQMAPVLFISTPKGRNWFWRMEEHAKARMAVGDESWLHLHATIYDNPHIDRREIQRIKEETSDIRWRQEYLAQYDTATGLVYPEFVDKQAPVGHIVPPLSAEARSDLVKNHVPIYRMLDWGLRNPTAVLSCYVEDEEVTGTKTGRRILRFFQEHYQSEWTVPQHAEKIKAMHEGMSVQVTYCDPSMRNRQDREFSTSRVAQFAKEGIPLYPANNNVKEGIELVKRLLRQKLVTFTADMVNTIAELRSYEWESVLGDDDKPVKEKPKKVKDHACDALKYGCVMLARSEAFQQFEVKSDYDPQKPKGDKRYLIRRERPDMDFDAVGGYFVA